MNEKTAPVDVLVVLDECIQSQNDALANWSHESLPEARAAIAELIKADKRVSERSLKKAGGGFWMVSNEDMASLRASLARVGGGK